MFVITQTIIHYPNGGNGWEVDSAQKKGLIAIVKGVI